MRAKDKSFGSIGHLKRPEICRWAFHNAPLIKDVHSPSIQMTLTQDIGLQ